MLNKAHRYWKRGENRDLSASGSKECSKAPQIVEHFFHVFRTFLEHREVLIEKHLEQNKNVYCSIRVDRF